MSTTNGDRPSLMTAIRRLGGRPDVTPPADQPDADAAAVAAALADAERRLDELTARQGAMVLAGFNARDALARTLTNTSFMPAAPNGTGSQVEIPGQHVNVTLLFTEEKETVLVSSPHLPDVMRFTVPGWVLGDRELRFIRGGIAEVIEATASDTPVVRSANLTGVVEAAA